MPDATGLELIAQRVRENVADEAVTGTLYAREQATLEVAPERVRDVLAYLREAEEPWELLISLHGCNLSRPLFLRLAAAAYGWPG